MEVRETLCGLLVKEKISRTTTLDCMATPVGESNLIIIHLISRIWMRRVKKRGISFLFFHACRCLHYSSMKTSFFSIAFSMFFIFIQNWCRENSRNDENYKYNSDENSFFFFQILDGEKAGTQWKKKGGKKKRMETSLPAVMIPLVPTTKCAESRRHGPVCACRNC